MRYLILLCILIASVTTFAAPGERNNLTSITKRLNRLESEMNRLAEMPEGDSKKRSQIYISLRLRRLQNRIAATEAQDSAKLSVNRQIEVARKKLRSSGMQETTPSVPSGNGVIKGRIRDAETGKPITDIWVEIDIYDSEGDFVSYGYADDRGRYAVSRLSEGEYYAVTYGVQEETDYVDQLYDNIPCYDSRCNVFNGEPISVTPGNVTSGINFSLVHGAHITGHVVDANTAAPLFDQEVDIYDNNSVWGLYAYGYTDITGFYDTGGYVTGEHHAATTNIHTGGSIHVDELYSNIACWALQCNILNGTPIQVTTGETTSEINFSLDEGGRFSGRIMDANNNLPIATRIRLYDSTGQWIFTRGSDADGCYEISGLATGNYFAVARDQFDYYHDEIYGDIPCSDEDCPVTQGTPIAVTMGQTTSGIDFALAPLDHITGRIIDAETNAPLRGIDLRTYDSNGVVQRIRSTDSSGIYHIGPITPGTYFLRAFSHRHHIDELYAEIACFDQACEPTDGTPIIISEGNVTSGIDFSLEPCLYCIDFEYFNEPWTNLKPTWTVSNRSLIGTSTLTKAVMIATPAFEGCSKCSVRTSMKTEGGSGNALYLLGWYQDHRNTIELIMKQETGKWVMRQHVNGSIVTSASADFDIQTGVFYNVEIIYNGTDLDLKVDGVRVLSLRPIGNLFGTVGFKVKNTTGRFGPLLVNEY